jgi:putative endonuclease
MAKHDFTAVYLLASRRNGKLYLGATTDLISRMIVHRAGAGPAIAVRHGCRLLVWFERRADMDDAVTRQREVRRLTPIGKSALIEATNRTWRDLFPEIAPPSP